MSRSISRRRFLKSVSLAAVGTALGACMPVQTPAPGAAPPPAQPATAQAPAPTAPPPPKAQAPLVVIAPQNTGLEPQLHGSGAQRVLTTNIYENLVKLAPDGKTILPSLAESWKRVDNLTYEFSLRKGVKFHSGDPFDAEAVKYSFERYAKPENKAPQLSQYAFKTPVIVDAYTVRISTEKPDPLFLKRMAGIGTTIVNPRFAEAKGLEGMNKEADGTGPYRCTAWKADGEIVLEAFNEHWRGKPKVQKVIQRAVVEPATRVAALLAGEADLIFAVPPAQADAIVRGGKKLGEVEVDRVSFYPFVMNAAPANNKLFRQACNYASNFDSIIKNVLNGRGYRRAAMLQPTHFGYNPDLKPYPYDPEKAKQLLAEAGYPNGVDVDMLQLVGRIPYDKEVGEALAGELGKVGIRCKLKLVDIAGANAALWENPNLSGFHHITWGNSWKDGDYGLAGYWRSDTFFATKGHHYNNPEFDRITDEAKYELDEAKRLKLFQQAERILYDDAVAIWGYSVQSIFGLSERLTWTPRTDELVLYEEMTLA